MRLSSISLLIIFFLRNLLKSLGNSPLNRVDKDSTADLVSLKAEKASNLTLNNFLILLIFTYFFLADSELSNIFTTLSTDSVFPDFFTLKIAYPAAVSKRINILDIYNSALNN